MADTLDVLVRNALSQPLADNVFPDVAPKGTKRPYGTYQRVGGEPSNTFDGLSTTRNARVQVNVWADTRIAATTTMDASMVVLCSDPINASPIGEPVNVYEEDTKLYGSRLDFSIWYLT